MDILKLILVTVLLVFSLSSFAQLTPGKKPQFSSINVLGVTSGASGESFIVSTINGVAKNKWFGGVGVGIDYYRHRTIPLFVDIRTDILATSNTPFIYAEGGVHLPWATTEQKNIRGGTSDFSAGGMYEGGIGWNLKGKNNLSFVISAGYSYKQVKETVSYQRTPIDVQPASNDYYDERYKKLNIKVGIKF